MQTTAEQVAPGVTYESLYDGHIANLRLTSVSRSSVDAWIERTKIWLRTLPDDQPAYLLQDISDKAVSQTPYIRARLKEYQEFTPKREVYLALVVGDDLSSQLARISTTAAVVGTSVHTQVFYRREEALTWLINEVDGNQKR